MRTQQCGSIVCGSTNFTKECSRAKASELEYARTIICDNAVKQIARPRDSKIQDSASRAEAGADFV